MLTIGSESSPSLQAVRQGNADELQRALAKLLPGQRLVIKIVHLQGGSIAAAAAQLDRSTAATAKLLQRGMVNLRKVLASAAEVDNPESR